MWFFEWSQELQNLSHKQLSNNSRNNLLGKTDLCSIDHVYIDSLILKHWLTNKFNLVPWVSQTARKFRRVFRILSNLCDGDFLLHYKWDKAFKNGLSKICGRQPLKNLKDIVCYLFKFSKGCLPKMLLGPFLYTLSQMFDRVLNTCLGLRSIIQIWWFVILTPKGSLARISDPYS